MTIHPYTLLGCSLALLASGCGKPPPPQGPPSGFPVPSVVGKATRERLEQRLPLVGSVRSKDKVRLQSETEGRVLAVNFSEGNMVKAGDILFQVDQRRPLAQLAEATARVERANQDLTRGEELLASKTIPPQEVDRLKEAALVAKANHELAKSALEDTTITAPFAGVIGERAVSVGQFLSRGGELATLTRVDPLEIAFEVPERFVSGLAKGQKVNLSPAAWPGKVFAAEVTFLAPELESASRSLRVKAELPNPDGALRPGMFGTVDLVFAVRENALVIPEGAVMQRGDQAMVLALGAENKAEFRPIAIGLRMAGKVEVLSGLKEGDMVVVEGHQKAAPGSTIVIMPGSSAHGVTPPPAAAAAAKPAEPAKETKKP